ncbi:MAG: hypothetical protein EZS28_015454, partial [Streblomastix strix]
MEKDPEINENQIERHSERKITISLIQSDQNTQANPNIDLNYISTYRNTPHKPSSPHSQQHSASPPLEETLAILRTISPCDPRGYKEREPEPKQPKLQQYVGLMDVTERFHEIMKPIIEGERMKPKIMLPGQYKHYPNKDGSLFFYPPKIYRPIPIPRPKDLDLSEEQWEQFDGDVREGVVPIIYQSIPEAVIGLVTFAAQQIVESETESEDQEQLTNQVERIVADGTDDNEDNDQSEHAMESKHFTNGNDGLRKNDSGTQLQATVNGEADPEFNIIKTFANIPFHNVNGSDVLGGNGCGTQLQAATNVIRHENHQAIDNTGNRDNYEQAIDNRIGGQQQNNQGSNNEIQHQQDCVNNKPEQIGSPHTIHSEQELIYLNTSQSKGQPPLITTPPKLNQVKGKVVILKQKIHQPNELDTESKQVNQSPYPISSQGVPKLEPTLTLLTTSHQSSSGVKWQMQPQLLKTNPQDAPKAPRPMQNPRNRNMDSTKKTRQKQSPIPRLTNRISWTEEKRDQERREGKDLENRETDKENREILDGNGRINSEIFRIMGNNQYERLHPINIYSPVGTEEEAREYKIKLEEELKENIVIPIKKEQIKRYNLTFMIKKANGILKKILDAKALNKQITDFYFKMHDSIEVKQTKRFGDWGTSLDHTSAFHRLIVQAESQPYLAFEFQNNHYTYRAMPFETKHSSIYFCNGNGTDNVINKNENLDQNNQLCRRCLSRPLEQGVSKEHDLKSNRYTEIFQIHNEHGKERDRTESNSNILRMGMKSSKCNSENETEEVFTSPTRLIQYEKMDKDRNKNNSKINSEVNRKAKLSKTVILRSLTLPEHNGPSESISCKIERMEYNDDNEQNVNPRYKM